MFHLPAIPGRVAFLVLLLMLAGPLATVSSLPALAQTQADNPSGLPLPRFVTTRSAPINVRVGPGTKYEIAWNYLVSGVPVEIIQEFDTWRKIRDVDGDEGWVHQSLLIGNRAGFATPLVANGEVVMRAGRAADASVRARLAAGVKVSISACEENWCQVTATQAGGKGNYTGWVQQEELWGVYPDESFD